MAEPHPRLSVEEYLAFERQSEEKHEFLDGEVFAMTGASRQYKPWPRRLRRFARSSAEREQRENL